MAQSVTMPKMGFDVLEATIIRWLKREGDRVFIGEVIVEVETDKAIVELESLAEGSLLTINAPEGTLVPVGAILAQIGAPGEQLPIPGPSVEATRVSPVAQRIAAERGIDIATLTGTGSLGHVTKEDVLYATSGIELPATGLRIGFPPRTPDTEGKITLGPMGEAIARRTEATMRDVPHFYINITVDMTSALELRRQFNHVHVGPTRASLNDIIIRASTIALLKYPVFNSTFEGDHLSVHSNVNIGIAVALPEGLMVPAIPNCETKSLAEIAQASKDLAQRARSGTLRQSEYSGTFSVSNLGMFNVDSFTVVIVAPQVAVLGVSTVRPTPVVISDELVIRRTMTITLGVDHRVAHGAEAAQFLAELKFLLENPSPLTQ